MKKETRRIRVLFGSLALVLAVALVATGCASSQPAASAKVLKIGSVMPLSGPQGSVGLAWARGYDIAADIINEEGGVRVGDEVYRIEVINEDSKMNPEAAASGATKLVHQDGVKFVIGEIIDPSGEAIYGVTAPAKAMHISSFLNIPGGPADVSPNRPLKVRLGIHNGLAHPIVYDYLVKAYPNVKTVVLAEMDIGLDPVLEDRKAVAEKHGIKVLGTKVYPIESFDLYPLYTQVLSLNPDAIDIGNSPIEHAIMHVKAARELGFKGPLFHHSPADPGTVLRAVGPEKSGDFFGAGLDITSPNVTPEMKKVLEKWKAKYSEDFVSDCLLAYDVVWTLVQGVQKARSTDPEAVLKALEGMNQPGSLKSVFGSAQLGGAKTFGVDRVLVRPIPVSVIKNGKVELVGLTPATLP